MADLLRRVRKELSKQARSSMRRVRLARVRGDQDREIATLLDFTHQGEATAADHARLRRLTGVGAALPAGPVPPGAPMPPARPMPSGAPAGASGAGQPPTLTVTATAGVPRFSIGGRDHPVWRDEWAGLAPVLAEQLAACAATGLAARHGVTAVELAARGETPAAPPFSGATPAAERIARAVATALGTTVKAKTVEAKR